MVAIFLFLLLTAQTVRAFGPIPLVWPLSEAQQTQLGLEPQPDRNVQFWLELRGTQFVLVSEQETEIPLGRESFSTGFRAKILPLLENGKDAPHWKVTLDGKSYEASLVRWHLIADFRVRRNQTPIHLYGIRGMFYIPQLGEIEIFRPIRAREMRRKRLSVRGPLEYRVARTPNREAGPAAQMPDGLWSHPVVILAPGQDGPRSIPAEVWEPPDSPGTFRVRAAQEYGISEFELPYYEVRRAVEVMRAEEGFEPLLYMQPRSASVTTLETLLIDTRAGVADASLYYVVRHQTPAGGSRFELLTPEKVVPRSLRVQTHAVNPLTVRAEVVRELARRFDVWRQLHSPLGIFPSELFAFVRRNLETLKLGDDQRTRYDELTLIHPIGRADPQTPGLTLEQFADLRYLQQTIEAHPGERVVAGYRSLTRDMRLRSHLRGVREVFLLDQKLTSAEDLLELLAQSAVGARMLREILPLVRQGTLQIRLGEPPAQSPPFVSEGNKTVFYVSPGPPVEVFSLFVFDVAWGLRSGMIRPVRIGADTGLGGFSPLERLHSALESTRRILNEVSLRSSDPGALTAPSFDRNLFLRAGVTYDQGIVDQTRRETLLCGVAITLAAGAGSLANLPLSGWTSPE